ncbi:MAG: sugar ABC transporter ATP-binding protein [Planctomycetota bacterium]
MSRFAGGSNVAGKRGDSASSSASPSHTTAGPIDSTPILATESIRKRFGDTQALDGVSMSFEAGQCTAVIGENGAGKSTFMRTLAGIVTPDEGTVLIHGEPVILAGPAHAIDLGIALIHQELNLHDNLSVAENLFLGREPLRGSMSRARWFRAMGLLDRSAMHEAAEKLLTRIGLNVAPQTPLASLSIAQKQLVEIARCLSTDASVVIMDEPTSSLSAEESESLFELIEQLNQDGVAVIYISHRLGEIQRLASRVEVLRDGCHVATLTGEQIEHDQMVAAMVGRDLSGRRRVAVPIDRDTARPLVQVDAVRVEHADAPEISLQVSAGEIVALAGLVGAGRSELAETLFGVRPMAGGRIRLDGETLSGSVDEAVQSGMAMVPEDRKTTGVLVASNVRDNATFVGMGRLASRWFRDHRWQAKLTEELIERLQIKAAGQEALVGALSGGNQQKVALAKWFAMNPKFIILDEPTRGVDIGAKDEIYRLIDQLAKAGTAILLISSEMEEVFALADRVLVMADGRVTGELHGSGMTEQAIMQLAIGSPADA